MATSRKEKSEKRLIDETSEILRLAIDNIGLSNRAFAKKANIDERRLYSYTSGQVALFKASAGQVMDLAIALGIDPMFLTGHRDIEEYFSILDSEERMKDLKARAAYKKRLRKRLGKESELEKIQRGISEAVERAKALERAEEQADNNDNE